MRVARSIVALAAVGIAVAGCRYPDTMTAVDHEQEARRMRAEIASAESVVRVQQTTQPMPSATESMADPGTPLVDYAGARAAYDAQSAVKHEEAALRIRREAEVACLRVPVAERVVCPIGEVAKLEALQVGVRIVLKAPGATETLRARVDCAVAEARVDRPGGADDCPLLVPGTTTRVVDRPAGAVVEVSAPDEPKAAEVRRRAELLLRR